MLLGTLTLLPELDPSKTWPDIVMLIILPYNTLTSNTRQKQSRKGVLKAPFRCELSYKHPYQIMLPIHHNTFVVFCGFVMCVKNFPAEDSDPRKILHHVVHQWRGSVQGSGCTIPKERGVR